MPYKQCGCQPLADVRRAGFQVFGENRRGRTVLRPQIAVIGLDVADARVVVDDHMRVWQTLTKIRGLHIEEGNTGKAAQGFGVGEIDGHVQ